MAILALDCRAFFVKPETDVVISGIGWRWYRMATKCVIIHTILYGLDGKLGQWNRGFLDSLTKLLVINISFVHTFDAKFSEFGICRGAMLC